MYFILLCKSGENASFTVMTKMKHRNGGGWLQMCYSKGCDHMLTAFSSVRTRWPMLVKIWQAVYRLHHSYSSSLAMMQNYLVLSFVQNQHYLNFLCPGQQKNTMQNIIWHAKIQRQHTLKLMELQKEFLATNYMNNNKHLVFTNTTLSNFYKLYNLVPRHQYFHISSNFLVNMINVSHIILIFIRNKIM